MSLDPPTLPTAVYSDLTKGEGAIEPIGSQVPGLPSAADQKYHPAIVTSRGMRIGQLVLSVAFAGLGIWALGEGDHVKGAFYLSISVAWLLVAAFKDRSVAARERQRARLRS
jgi:hypothetical protein